MKSNIFKRAVAKVMLSAGMTAGVLFGPSATLDVDAAGRTKKSTKPKTEKVNTKAVSHAKILGVSEKSLLDPNSVLFNQQCRALEDEVMAIIKYVETFREKPVQQPAGINKKTKKQQWEAVYTQGDGLTWDRLENGQWVRNWAVAIHKGKKVKKHKPVQQTEDQLTQKTRLYLREKAIPLIQQFLKVPITPGEYYGLVVAMYQGDGFARTVSKKLNAAKTRQAIEDAYMGNISGFGGTLNRRWVCGAFAGGHIAPSDIMDSYVDGFYAVPPISLVTKNGKHFNYSKATIKKVLAARQVGATKPTLREKLNRSKSGKLIAQNVSKHAGNGTQIAETANITTEAKRMEATKLFKQGKYAQAAKKFEALIKENPQDFAARNDLALTYIRQKKYDSALEQINYITRRCKDKVQLGNAFYNAGLIREAKGEIARAKANYERARDNGNAGAERALAKLESDKKAQYKSGSRNVVASAKRTTRTVRQSRVR